MEKNTAKNIILLGAPGSGKGTQAVRLNTKYKIPHISTGDIFRKNLKEGTPVGLKAKGYMDAGQLVPDEVVIEIVKNRLAEKDCADGYLLDGFPRTVAQAEAMAEITKIGRVVNIDIPLDRLTKRLTGRRVCSVCGESYHIDTYADKKCVKCRGDVIQRADDNHKTVSDRLDVYVKQTAPLIKYYTDAGVLITVDGDRPIDIVTADIVEALQK